MKNKNKDNYWTSPTTKSKLRVLTSTEETQGKSVIFEFENQPDDIGPPAHFHPDKEESFTVIEGELTVKVAGKITVLKAGENAVVPKNTSHTFWNASQKPVLFTSEHKPARQFESFIKSIYDMDYDGLVNEKGSPPLMKLMPMIQARTGEQWMDSPPVFIQRMGIFVMGTIGKILGNKKSYVSQKRIANKKNKA